MFAQNCKDILGGKKIDALGIFRRCFGVDWICFLHVGNGACFIVKRGSRRRGTRLLRRVRRRRRLRWFSLSNESFPAKRRAILRALRAFWENAVPILAAPESRRRRRVQLPSFFHRAIFVRVRETKDCSRLSIWDRYPENACQCRPGPPRRAMRRTARARARRHRNAPPVLYQRATRSRPRLVFVPLRGDGGRSQYRCELRTT